MSETALFFDTSALLQAYLIREPYSSFVLERMQAADVSVVSRLVHLEIHSALIQRQHRDHAERLSARQVAILLADFERNWEFFEVVELSVEVMERASDMVRSHAGVGLRALDAVHLACALEAQAEWATLEVLTFDRRQAGVARALGLNVIPLSPGPM